MSIGKMSLCIQRCQLCNLMLGLLICYFCSVCECSGTRRQDTIAHGSQWSLCPGNAVLLSCFVLNIVIQKSHKYIYHKYNMF